MEERVTTAFDKINEKLTPEERDGRIDIRYKKMAGQHVIIELKRPCVKISQYDLAKQVHKYRIALEKQLETVGLVDESIEIICIVGQKLSEWINSRERATSIKMLAEEYIRVVLYDELINGAIQSYKEFLEIKKEAGSLCELINNINIDALNST